MEASNIHFQVPVDNETEEEGLGSGSVSPLPPPPNPRLTFTAATPTPSLSVPTTPGATTPVAPTTPAAIDDERTSFLSTSSDSSSYGTKDDVVRRQSTDAPAVDSRRASVDDGQSPIQIDIRGWALTQHTEFWRLFLMLGILTGIGLMTIK
ncbi:hypothetical protein AA313_de0202458 [Arthrobotrys entomopaga]|nr:hypothetical protein AA313_de0202458 [Arthrobotrys entomopaga]